MRFCRSASPWLWRVGKSLMSRGMNEKPATWHRPVLARGSDRRFHADRRPRWCVRADRLRASRRGPGWSRRSTTATSIPRQRQLAGQHQSRRAASGDHDCMLRSSLHPSRFASARVLPDDRGLEASPLRTTYLNRDAARRRHGDGRLVLAGCAADCSGRPRAFGVRMAVGSRSGRRA